MRFVTHRNVARLAGVLAVLLVFLPGARQTRAQRGESGGARPAEFRLDGFLLQVDGYDPGAGPAGGVAGKARAFWPGDGGAAPLPVRFDGVRFRADGTGSRSLTDKTTGSVPKGAPVDDGVARASGGRASASYDRAVELSLDGHAILVERLHLGVGASVATLGLRIPGADSEALHVPLGEVELSEGGRFVAGAGVPETFPDLPREPGPALRLAGGSIVVDLDETRSSAYAERPEARGVLLRDGLVRVRVTPPPSRIEVDRDLFFVEEPERAFLFARFDALRLSAAGTLEGEGLRVVPVAGVPRFSDAEADLVLVLFLPVGFGIELDGGRVDLADGRIAAVDLAGRLHLPLEIDGPPIEFEHLVRRADGRDGFESEELSGRLMPLQLGAFSYRPAHARIELPGAFVVQPGVAVLPPQTLAQVLPEEFGEIRSWEENLRDRFHAPGVVLWGGVLAAPWKVERPRSSPPAPPQPPTVVARRFPMKIGGLLSAEEMRRATENLSVVEAIELPRPAQPADPDPASADRTTVPKVDLPSSGRTDLPSKLEVDRPAPPVKPAPRDSLRAPARASRTFLPDAAPTRRGAESGPPFVVDTSHNRRRGAAVRTRGRFVPTASASAGSIVSGTTAGVAASTRLDQLRRRIDGASRFPNIHAAQGGAFLLGSGGVEGSWILLEDPERREVGDFTARLERTLFEFRQSTLTQSFVQGVLEIPYPASIEIPFAGSLTTEGEILIAEHGLVPPAVAEGWYFDYWKMSVFPELEDAVGSRGLGPITSLDQARQSRAGIDRLEESIERQLASRLLPEQREPQGPRRPLIFEGDRIVVPFARMRLDVSEEFGGVEFTTPGEDRPFTISFALRGNGQLEDARIRPAELKPIEFLGIPFQPDGTTVRLRRYVGDHEPPDGDEERHPGWLVQFEGSLAFNLFGERRVRVNHTAMGARVPFVQPTAVDENGRPTPVVADSAGVILVDARLRFVNTFGMPEAGIRGRFPPRSVEPNRPFEPDGGDNLVIEPFKAFVGDATIRVLHAISVNGVAEVGQWMRESGDLKSYEKIGVGGGVDVIRAVIAGLHGMETVADLGGAGVEILTGAKGLGAEVVHVATDGVKFSSSAATTAGVIALAATTGTTAGQIEGEVRHLIGNGLELSASSVDLMKEIYKQEPFYEPSNPLDPTTDPPYVGLEIADILLTASAKGIEFDQLEPKDVAEILLQSLDVAIPLLQAIQTGDVGVDQKANVALAVSHVIVKASRALIEDGAIGEELAWQLADRMVVAAKLFSELPEVRDEPALEHLPLALAIAEVSVDIGQSIRYSGDELELAALIDLVDQILTLGCQNPQIVEPLLTAGRLPARDASNVLAASQTVFDALNNRAFLEGQLDARGVVTQVALPLLDGFIEGDASGACAGVVRYDPYDAEVRALLRVARQVLRLAAASRGAETGEADGRALLAWSVATVFETMQAINTIQPGTLDERIVVGMSSFHSAIEGIDPSQPPAAQLLRFANSMIPTVRVAVEAIPDVDPLAPKIVDVLGAALGATLPIAEGRSEELDVWLDGSLQVVNAVRELPLRSDARAGLSLASKALVLGRDGTRGTLTPIQLVRGSQEIVDDLRVYHGGGVLTAALPSGFAPDDLLGDLGPDAQQIDSALGVASAILDALGDTLEEGRLSIASIGELLDRVVRALAPALDAPFATRGAGDDGFAALGAAIAALPILDPTRPAEDAARDVLVALLDAEERHATDPLVISSIRRARGALTGSDLRVVNAPAGNYDRLHYDEQRSRRLADAHGGVQTVAVVREPVTDDVAIDRYYFESQFPEGHPRHPGGLHEVFVLPADLVDVHEVEESTFASRDLPELEAALLQAEFPPQLREYRDADGCLVRFVRRGPDDRLSPGAIGAVTVLDPEPTPEFRPLRTIETDGAPYRGQPADELSGPILQARWSDETTGRRFDYVAGAGTLHAHDPARPGDLVIREVSAEARFTTVDAVPRDGKILAFRGPVPGQPENRSVEYRDGSTALLVHEGASYDRLTSDPLLPVFDPVEIPLDGQLAERRFVDTDDGSVWLFRPGVNALRVDGCGGWQLFALGPLTDFVASPNPSAPFPQYGELLASGNAFGSLLDPEGQPLPAASRERLRIEVQEGGALAMQYPEGRQALMVVDGTTTLLPFAGEAFERSACSEGADPAEVAAALPARPVVTVGSPRAQLEIERTVAGQRVALSKDDAKERGRVTVRATQPTETCEGADEVSQSFTFGVGEPFFTSRVAGKPIIAPPIGDPDRAYKILALNSFETDRQELLVDPSIEAVIDLHDDLESARQGDRLMHGIAARASVAMATALSDVVTEHVASLLAGESDPETVAGWLAETAEDNPLDRILEAIGAAHRVGLLISPRLPAALVRVLPQVGVDRHPLSVALSRAADDLDTLCTDPRVELRARGALAAAAMLRRSDLCVSFGVTWPRIDPGLAALAAAQNACLAELSSETSPPEYLMVRAEAAARWRDGLARRIGLDGRFPAETLEAARKKRVQRVIAELNGTDSPDVIESRLGELLEHVTQGALGGAEATLPVAVVNASIGKVLTNRTRAVDELLSRCQIVSEPGAACDPITLVGCRLQDGCPAEALARRQRQLLESLANGAWLGVNSPGALAGDRPLNTVKVQMLHARAEAAAAFRRGSLRRLEDAVGKMYRQFSVTQALGLDEDGELRSMAVSEFSTLLELADRELQQADSGNVSQVRKDEILHLALSAMNLARIEGVTRPALLQRLLAEAPGLEQRDRERLTRALSRPIHDPEEIDAAIDNLLQAVRLPIELTGGESLAAGETARRQITTLFTQALTAAPDRHLALPNPDRMQVRDGSLELPTPYIRYIVVALIELQDPPFDARQRAADYLRRVVARFDRTVGEHRAAVAQLGRFLEYRLRLDGEQRTREGRPPVTAEQDPLVAVLGALATDLGSNVLAVQLGRLNIEATEAVADRLEAEVQDALDALEQLRQDPDSSTATVTVAEAAVERAQQRAADARSRADELADAGVTPAAFEDVALGIDSLVQRNESIVGFTAEAGVIVSPQSLVGVVRGNRFQAAANQLEAGRAAGGPHLELAYRLAAHLPDPSTSSGFGYRAAAIPQIALFLVDGLLLESPTGGVGTRSASGAGSEDPWKPSELLISILEMTQVNPDQPASRQCADLVSELLTRLGQDTEQPVFKAGLTVTAASIEGLLAPMGSAAATGEVDWIEVIDRAAGSLAEVYEPGAPPEDFWLGFAGRLIRVGLDFHRGGGDPEAASVAALRLAHDFLDYPDVQTLVDQVPEPGAYMIVTVKGLVGETLDNTEAGDPLDVALARVLADAAFARAPEPYGPLGRDLSGWAFDFARAHHDALVRAATAGADDPQALAGVTEALLTAEGIPSLTCVLNEHFDDLEVPPGLALLPFVGIHEFIASPDAFSSDPDDRPRALFDVSAGLMNLWLSEAATATCQNPLGLAGEEAPFARALRGLKDVEVTDALAAFDLVGRFGLGAVDTFAPGSTMGRALHTIWWGQESPPAPGVPFVGLGSALANQVDEIVFALAVPRIAGDVVAILAEDPALEELMDVLGGNCEPEYLLPPDHCYPNVDRHGRKTNKGTLPNLMLKLLADMRVGMKPALTRDEHETNSTYGYLQSLPVMKPGENNMLDLARAADLDYWEKTVELLEDIEQVEDSAARSGMAAVDLARMTVNAINSLPTIDPGGPTAQHIQEASLFAPQTGGEFFSGVAGGMMREWPLGGDPDEADLYFELVGQIVIPALVRTAGQLSFQNQGDDWMLMLRAAGNFPDFDAVAEQIGVAVPANDIASAFLIQQEGYLTGWLGVADERPYAQLYSRTAYTRGAAKIMEINLSGFVQGFEGDDPLEQLANVDVGLCAEYEQALVPSAMDPMTSLFTFGLGGTATVGGYFFKRDTTVGVGYKTGLSTEMNVPLFPIAGIRLGADVGGAAEADLALDGPFPDMQLSVCARPYITGNLFGIQLADFDANIELAVFGEFGDANVEAGTKMRLRVAEDYVDLIRENLSCPNLAPVEAFLCGMIEGDEGLGVWLTITNKAVYYGLGAFPAEGETVLHSPLQPDGTIGLPGFTTVQGWGGFSSSPFDTCDDAVCGGIDSPPLGATFRGEPDVGGAQ